MTRPRDLVAGPDNHEILSIRSDVKFTGLDYSWTRIGLVSNTGFAAVAVSERLTNYCREARWRAQRRKSAWNILLALFCFGTGLALWYAFFQLVWAFHAALYPDHRFHDFWQPGIGASSFALSFLMMFAPVPGAITLGFMLGNVMAWLIPPARRTLDAEAEGYPGTSFRDSMQGLARICLWTLPTGLCIAFIAAYSLNSLR